MWLGYSVFRITWFLIYSKWIHFCREGRLPRWHGGSNLGYFGRHLKLLVKLSLIHIFSKKQHFFTQYKCKLCHPDHHTCLENSVLRLPSCGLPMMWVKQDGKEEIHPPRMTGIKAQTFKEIKENDAGNLFWNGSDKKTYIQSYICCIYERERKERRKKEERGGEKEGREKMKSKITSGRILKKKKKNC